MKFLKYLTLICCCIAMVACDDEITTIGSSLDNSKIEVTVDSSFVYLTGKSVYSDSILGRTTDPLLGNLSVENYGDLRTGYLTQFMPTLKIDTTGVTVNTLDSIKLSLNYYNKDLYGDSLAPMVLNIYRLDKTVKSPLYTNLDPTEYYSPENLLVSYPFGSSTEGYLDENNSTDDEPVYYKRMDIKMPLSLGQEIFEEYKKNPDIFSMPSDFAEFFPGVYMNIAYGNGRMINIKGIFMSMFYRAIDSVGEVDTLTYNYMGVTPEISSINHFSLKPDATLLNNIARGNESGKTVYVQAPIGYMPIVKFPAQSIIDKYNEKLIETNGAQNILNALSFSLPAVVSGDEKLSPPEHLLFIRASQVKDFFEDRLIPDNVNTVYATYDKNKKVYDFGNIGSYIREIMDREDPTVTEDDETIALIPVQIITETTTNYYDTTTSIVSVTPHSASPGFVELDLSKAMIKITYTTQSFK